MHPFRTFSGCGVGSFENESKLVLQPTKNARFTQFDMHFWVAMLQNLSKRKEVRAKLIYFPNSSIYILGDFYRYVEYKYVKTKREHSIWALKKSEVLDLVYQASQNGITIEAMIQILADDPSEAGEAKAYIDELIDGQFLVSNLDATITGDNEWQRVLNILMSIPQLEFEIKQLEDIQNAFDQIDNAMVPDSETYNKIKESIQEMGFDFEEKYLFQTDIYLATNQNVLSNNIPQKIKEALHFLNGIQKKNRYNNLANFSKTFVKRYESREMPLMTVLDTETGIGYLQNSEMNDTHDILDGFSFRSNSASEDIIQQSWSSSDFVLQKKLQDCIYNNELTISLTAKDFPDFDVSWENTPTSFSVMVEVYKVNSNEMIAIESSGGISAAKLLGRFCSGHEEIHTLTKEIVAKEQAFHHDKILAEIVHIPESRTGNILRRPVLREYEIAYLSNLGVTRDKTIDLNDLWVSVQGNKIVLRSKKYNKEVIPCLSNAHNYGSRALPIYQFLCDLQAQNVKPIYNFSWGVLESHYNYFPRVLHKEVILAKAKWLVDAKELVPFAKLTATPLTADFTKWRIARKIPKYVNWVQSDNTLLLDFEKAICITMFLKSVGKYTSVILEEFLFDGNSIVVDDKNEHYANQVIVSFYRE